MLKIKSKRSLFNVVQDHNANKYSKQNAKATQEIANTQKENNLVQLRMELQKEYNDQLSDINDVELASVVRFGLDNFRKRKATNIRIIKFVFTLGLSELIPFVIKKIRG